MSREKKNCESLTKVPQSTSPDTSSVQSSTISPLQSGGWPRVVNSLLAHHSIILQKLASVAFINSIPSVRLAVPVQGSSILSTPGPSSLHRGPDEVDKRKWRNRRNRRRKKLRRLFSGQFPQNNQSLSTQIESTVRSIIR